MKKNSSLRFLLIVIVSAILPFAFFKGLVKLNNYKTNGSQVSCIITKVTKVVKTRIVECIYIDSQGKLVKAKITANKNVSQGDEITGYVLPDNPAKVYCVPSKGYIIFSIVVCLVYLIAVMVALGVRLKRICRHRYIKKHGVLGSGEAVFVNKENRKWEVILRFVNDGGDEEFLKFHYSHGLPVVGEYYNIVYAVKPSGKILAELIDMKIN